MTETELNNSQAAKDWLKGILETKLFSAVLDMAQKKSLPTRGRELPIVPGVHHDTVIAHDDQYRAGWSDAIEYLRNLPTGNRIQWEDPAQEEWGSSPEVLAIDAEIERFSKTAAKPKSKKTR